MDEFKNRIDAQRSILKMINNSTLYKNPLISISSESIEKWIYENEISKDDGLAIIVKEISKKSLLLGNKSEERITEDYKELSLEFCELEKKMVAIISDTAQF